MDKINKMLTIILKKYNKSYINQIKITKSIILNII